MMQQRSLWLRALIGATLITAVEFLVGSVVNLWLGWQVWDYSARFCNIYGQICPLFSGLWFLLCLPLMSFMTVINRREQDDFEDGRKSLPLS